MLRLQILGISGWVNHSYASGNMSAESYLASGLNLQSFPTAPHTPGKAGGLRGLDGCFRQTFNLQNRGLTRIQAIDTWKRSKRKAIRPIELKSKLQALMDEYVGMERNEVGLARGLEEVRKLRGENLPNLTVNFVKRYCYEVQEAYEIRGMLDLGEIVILSAMGRRETRGHHYQLDYPHTENTPFHTLVQFVNGEHKLTQIPVTRLKV